jgi:hypothetical protein
LFKKDFEVSRKAVNQGFSATGESVELCVHFPAESSFAVGIIAVDSCFLQGKQSQDESGAG